MLGTLSFFFPEGLGKFQKVLCPAEWVSTVLHTALPFMVDVVESSCRAGHKSPLYHDYRGRGEWPSGKIYPRLWLLKTQEIVVAL